MLGELLSLAVIAFFGLEENVEVLFVLRRALERRYVGTSSVQLSSLLERHRRLEVTGTTRTCSTCTLSEKRKKQRPRRSLVAPAA